MATIEDYLGMEFGVFKIERSIGFGAEAQVYAVSDFRTRRLYALRLDRYDDAMWEGAPVIPPRNKTVEQRNAKAKWEGAWSCFEVNRTQPFARECGKSRKSGRLTVTTFRPTAEYGVVDEMWLVPVSLPYRVPHCLDIDTVLQVCDLNTFRNCPVWVSVATQLVIDTVDRLDGKMSVSEWEDIWDLFASDVRIKEKLIPLLIGSKWISRTEPVLKLLLSYDGREDRMPLAHNILMRLVAAHASRVITTEQLVGTLKNRHFRMNVADWAMQHFLCFFAVILRVNQKQVSLDQVFEESMRIVLQTMRDQPVDEWEAPLKGIPLVTVAEQPSLDRYSLFLQEYAGIDQPFSFFSS